LAGLHARSSSCLRYTSRRGRSRLLSRPGALWNKATSWLYRPAPIIERRSPGEFVPCHPEPLRKDPNIIQIVLGARHNLIGGWMADHYRSADPLNPGGDFDATANVEQWSNARATQHGWAIAPVTNHHW
jgi:hypothetical protein